jgi:hypothetical protein
LFPVVVPTFGVPDLPRIGRSPLQQARGAGDRDQSIPSCLPSSPSPNGAGLIRSVLPSEGELVSVLRCPSPASPFVVPPSRSGPTTRSRFQEDGRCAGLTFWLTTEGQLEGGGSHGGSRFCPRSFSHSCRRTAGSERSQWRIRYQEVCRCAGITSASPASGGGLRGGFVSVRAVKLLAPIPSSPHHGAGPRSVVVFRKMVDALGSPSG